MAAKAPIKYPYGVPPPSEESSPVHTMSAASTSNNTESKLLNTNAIRHRTAQQRAPPPQYQQGTTNGQQSTNQEIVAAQRPLSLDSVAAAAQQANGRQGEDSFEYFIKFPTTNQGNEIETAESDFVFVYDKLNVPIVMLLGWAGCQNRYLMKYSKIYEDRGLITVRYIAPVDTLFWKRSAMIPIGEKILQLIYDMNLDAHPIFFHVFSNGGTYLYQHIALAMHRHQKPLQVRGMIFDSAPGERRILGLYRAISAIYGKDKRKYNRLRALVWTFALSVIWFLEEAYYAFKDMFVKTERAQTNPFHDLKNEANQFPQLFLYSKGDDVIPYQDVEKFIKLRAAHGVEISSVCFEDAEHVKIFTKYPQQYVQCVCNFINNCLTMPYKVLSYGTSTTSIDSTSIKRD